MSSASAADLPNVNEPPVFSPPAPVFTWTGLYAGLSGGYALDHAAFPYSVTLPVGYTAGYSGLTERGPFFGGQVGYNYEFDNVPLIGHAVIGVEADFNWANINGSGNAATIYGPETFGSRVEDFGSVRGRLGYNFDRLLLYVTSGPAFGQTHNYYNVPGFSGSYTTSRLTLPFGAYGAGLEYALTNNWSIKAEYIYEYVRAGWNSYADGPANIGFNTRATFHTARIGFNYRFDLFEPTPVVAKY